MALDPNITAVSETLFLPLYSLALESQRPDPIIVDEEAVALTRSLNAEFAGSDRPLFKRLAAGRLPSTLLTTMTLRIRRYDRYVSDFLEREPDGIVVSLGCGLDDRRRRVDNGTVRWYDLDLPEVIALRRRFLSESDRMRFIARSVLEFDWMDELPSQPGDKFLFVAEGLFMYLPAEGVRSLVTTLAERFAGCELVAEVAAARTVKWFSSAWGRGKFRRQFSLSEDVVFQFGVEDGHEFERWALGAELLDEWSYFDEDEPKLGWMRLFAGWEWASKVQWTVRYRLGGADKKRAGMTE